MGLPDLSHAALPDKPHYLVRTNRLTGLEAHDLGVLRGKRHTVAFP